MLNKLCTFGKHYPIPIFALLGLILGLIFYFPLHRPDMAQWIWLATLVTGGIPIVYETIKGIFRGEFASDIVAMLAIITAVIMREAFAGAVVVLMQSGGEALEAYGLRRASSSLEALLKRAPQFALKKIEGHLQKISVKEVQIGDTLIVRPGDLIPVDGTILMGTAEIDESALTGEPLAHSKSPGDPIFSGCIAVNGSFEMRADKISEESQYQKIVELVKKAQLEKAPIQRLADRYAIFFTPLTLFMSLLGFLITRDTTTILAVLVVATPCPLILATPLAILCGINKAAKEGIIVKGGAPIEQVGKTQVALFDKTGTITYGTPYLEEIIPLNHATAEELLYKCACIEQLSSHSIAKAVLEKNTQNLILPSHFHESPGRGVEGDIEQDHFTIGSHSYLTELYGHTCFKNCEETIDRIYAREKLLIFVAKNSLCIGALVISDRIRPKIPSLIEKLHSLGVSQVIMLTGDSEKNGAVIAKQAGIQDFKAELLPGQKAEIIHSLNQKFVTMVGDGINDAPALATATVGIAMGAHGSAISVEAADIVLLVDDVSKVADTIAIGQKTLHIAKQSILIGIGLSFILMIIAALGYIPPAIGALLQEVIDVAVILNALRVR